MLGSSSAATSTSLRRVLRFACLCLAFLLPAAAERCVCFSSCNASDTEDFTSRIPRVVESHTSPWYAYLEAVYGEGVPLPYDLSTLRFAYHGSTNFRRAHPTLEWPMARCLLTKHSKPGYADGYGVDPNWNKGPRGLQRDPSEPLCSPARCKRWVATSRMRLPVMTHAAYYLAGPAQAAGSTKRSEGLGTRWLHATVLPALPFQPDSLWLEVIRWNAPLEGGGHGVWFSPARGSGIFLPLGRTLHIRNKHVLAPAGDAGIVAAAVKGQYDTAQVQYASGDYEFEIVQMPGTRDRKCRQPPLCECSVLRLRTGWNHTVPCACEVSWHGLNCGWARNPTANGNRDSNGVVEGNNDGSKPSSSGNDDRPKPSSRALAPDMSCVTWAPTAAGNLSCVAAPGDRRPRGLIVPIFRPHYDLFVRLLQSIREHATDTVPVVAILSETTSNEVPKICGKAPRLCIDAGTFEATDLGRLIMFDDAAHGRTPTLARAAQLVEQVTAAKRRDVPGGFFIQAIKKLLAVRFAGIEMAWVLDSESRAFAPFSFKAIFDAYDADPTVISNGGTPRTTATPRGEVSARQLSLYKGVQHLLGLVDDWAIGAGYPELVPVYRWIDFWIWYSADMAAMMERAVTVHKSRQLYASRNKTATFVEAFLVSLPAGLAYATYAHWRAIRGENASHRFVPINMLEANYFGDTDRNPFVCSKPSQSCCRPPSNISNIRTNVNNNQLRSAVSDPAVTIFALDQNLTRICAYLAEINYPALRPRGKDRFCRALMPDAYTRMLNGLSSCRRPGAAHGLITWWLCEE